MPIYGKCSYIPYRKEWLGVIYEADRVDADPDEDKIFVHDVEVKPTREEIMAWIDEAKKTRPWEPRQ